MRILLIHVAIPAGLRHESASIFESLAVVQELTVLSAAISPDQAMVQSMDDCQENDQ
jgi:hypothetical protein